MGKLIGGTLSHTLVYCRFNSRMSSRTEIYLWNSYALNSLLLYIFCSNLIDFSSEMSKSGGDLLDSEESFSFYEVGFSTNFPVHYMMVSHLLTLSSIFQSPCTLPE